MLSIANLQAGYGPAQVLFNVSFAVGAGEVVTLLGRNGMGKTTTIRTLMGLVPARDGAATFDGRALIGLAPFVIAQAGLGLVPEGRQIFPTLTVEENLVATAAAQPRQPALGRRAADAGDRTRADDQPQAAHPRRGNRGPRPTDPHRDLVLPHPAQGRGTGDPAGRQAPRGADPHRR